MPLNYRKLFLSAVLAAAAALPVAFFAGCPEGEGKDGLPEKFTPASVVISAPSESHFWPRAGGTADNHGVSALEGPRTLAIDWEAAIGEGSVLSPVVDSSGKIYTGVLGGALVCLDPGGSPVFTFGGAPENGVTPDELRSQAALGDGQIWLATSGGIVCLDMDGKEIWRMESRFMPQGGVLNVAISPNGGLVASLADGSILLLDRTGQPITSVRTKGTSPNPASFDEDGNAYSASSDRNVYRISPEGRLNWTLNGKGAFLASPVLYKDRLFATCMDGYVYASDMRGRERWRIELLFDAPAREKELAKENEDYISGLYWPPLLRTAEAEGDAPGEFELVAMFSDRPGELKDAIYMGAWADAEGTRKMRKALAESFIAGPQFGAHPVMDATGVVYIALDNRVLAVKGKEIVASFQITGDAAVSGAQLVLAADKRLLVPMNDGRLVCLKEAEPAAEPTVVSADETGGGEMSNNGESETGEPVESSDGADETQE